MFVSNYSFFSYVANTDYEQREEVVTLSDLNPFEELIFPVMDDSEYEGRSNEIFFVQAQLDPNGQNPERVKIASDLARTPITIIDNEVRPCKIIVHDSEYIQFKIFIVY